MFHRRVGACADDPSASRALLDAAKRGDDTLVARLVRSGASVNVRGPERSTPLILAVRNGYFRCVQHLLRAPGIDVNAQTVANTTALMIAARFGRHKLIRKLLCVLGIDTTKRDNKNETALSLAITHGKHKCVDVLLCHEATFASTSETRYIDLLCMAIHAHRPNCFAQFLRVEKLDARSPGWSAVVRTAAFARHEVYLRALCDDPNVNMNAGGVFCDTLLHRCLRAATMLLKCPRVDVNLPGNMYNKTAIMYAAENIYEPENAVKLVMRHPDANVRAKDAQGNTALHYAARNRSDQSVAAMVALEGIDVHARNLYGETALWTAARYRRLRNIQYLLAYPGVDVNTTNVNGISVLGAASGKPELRIAEPSYDMVAIECVRTLISEPNLNIHGGGRVHKSALHLILTFFGEFRILRSHGYSTRLPPGECECECERGSERQCVLRPFLDEVHSLITRSSYAELRFALRVHMWLQHDILQELLGRARWGQLEVMKQHSVDVVRHHARADVVLALITVSVRGFGSASLHT